MSADWKSVTLGDLIDVKHGFAFKSEHFVEHQTELVLVTPGNFAIGGGFQEPKRKCYAGPVPSEYVLKEHDLVVTMTDLSRTTDTLGYAALIPHTGVTYLHNQRVGLVQIKDESIVIKAWLHYLMRSPEYRSWIVGSASGSTVKHTAPSRIKEYRFLLPPPDYQSGVASILDALEAQIRTLNDLNATLEAIAQAIFKSWFVDFDPVKAKAEGLEPVGMDAAAAELFPNEFEESELGVIPKGWMVDAIGNTVNCVGGGTPSTKEDLYWSPEAHHWVTPKDLSGATAPVLQSTERKLSDQGLKKISSGLQPEGTLLMSSRAPIGYLTISEIPVAINQGFIAMQPGGRLPPLFLYFWAKANMELIKQKANGSTFMEISKSAFRPIRVVVPSAKVLAKFMDIVTPLFSRIGANEKQRKLLSELRDTLLPRLVSGNLHLAGAQEELEDALA